MEKVKVSVIIPVYNVEAYIEECVKSVINQTLQEIEIICVNDGTPDASMEIVKRLAAEDERIHIIEKENGGLSTARNAGLNHARGEYVYFLDSDDYILPKTLEKLYMASIENGLDNIYFGADTIYESPEIKKKYYGRFEGYYHRKSAYFQVFSGESLFQKQIKNGEYRTSVCLQMPRREFLLQNGISFPEGILHEDNLFAMQSMLCAKKAMVVKDNFYVRRVRDASIMTGDKKVESSWGYYRCIREMLSFLEDKKFDGATMECIGDLMTVIQRDALWVIRRMDMEEVSEKIRRMGTVQEQLAYRLWVQNVICLQKQCSVLHRMREKIRRSTEGKR